MCVIVYKPENAPFPSLSILKNCWDNNDDGAGLMWPEDEGVSGRKGFMFWTHFKKYIEENKKRLSRLPVVFHFRIATHGGRGPECTHPFPVSRHTEDLRSLAWENHYGVAHNGIILGYGSSLYGIQGKLCLSDTQEFIQDVLAHPFVLKNIHNNTKDFKTFMTQLTSSKWALMTSKGNVLLIGDFEEYKGCFFSNDSYKKRSAITRVYSSLYSEYEDYNYYGRYTSGYTQAITEKENNQTVYSKLSKTTKCPFLQPCTECSYYCEEWLDLNTSCLLDMNKE